MCLPEDPIIRPAGTPRQGTLSRSANGVLWHSPLLLLEFAAELLSPSAVAALVDEGLRALADGSARGKIVVDPTTA